MSSKITQIVEIEPHESKGEQTNLMAYATIEINEDIIVKGLKIISGKNGLFLSWPTRKTSTGRFANIVIPKKGSLIYTEANDLVIREYRKKFNVSNEV